MPHPQREAEIPVTECRLRDAFSIAKMPAKNLEYFLKNLEIVLAISDIIRYNVSAWANAHDIQNHTPGDRPPVCILCDAGPPR